mmetsp:Transcript_17809/g.25045  ORF Transcript_17809/g.25045 Transcript_17809/m.25045 type:complete len:216 (+) Transcript_17809:2222-2869(+)
MKLHSGGTKTKASGPVEDGVDTVSPIPIGLQVVTHALYKPGQERALHLLQDRVVKVARGSQLGDDVFLARADEILGFGFRVDDHLSLCVLQHFDFGLFDPSLLFCFKPLVFGSEPLELRKFRVPELDCRCAVLAHLFELLFLQNLHQRLLKPSRPEHIENWLHLQIKVEQISLIDPCVHVQARGLWLEQSGLGTVHFCIRLSGEVVLVYFVTKVL